MFDLKRTHARTLFKDLLGQANHFLITILIGLEAVRDGTAKLDDEFRTVWNPAHVHNSADRSRQFALDLALVRSIDALDTYFIRTRRAPVALTSADFESRMDGADRKVSKRLNAFNEFLQPLSAHRKLFLKLAIDWRNRRVHSLADETLEDEELSELLEQKEPLRTVHSGLDITVLVARYRAGEAPSFKDAASVISLVHRTVEHFDAQLLLGLNVETYVPGLLRLVFDPAGTVPNNKLKQACVKTWGDEGKRETKVLRILRMAGIHAAEEIKGRQIPDQLVDRIVRMSALSALDYLTTTAPASASKLGG